MVMLNDHVHQPTGCCTCQQAIKHLTNGIVPCVRLVGAGYHQEALH